MEPRTGAERYLRDRQRDPEYAAAYCDARQRIAEVDQIMQAIDRRRVTREMSKAELARRIGVRPEAVRRLFAAKGANPTLATVVALAHELDLELIAVPNPSRTADPTACDAAQADEGHHRTIRRDTP